jgi:hypothetical protein
VGRSQRRPKRVSPSLPSDGATRAQQRKGGGRPDGRPAPIPWRSARTRRCGPHLFVLAMLILSADGGFGVWQRDGGHAGQLSLKPRFSQKSPRLTQAVRPLSPRSLLAPQATPRYCACQQSASGPARSGAPGQHKQWPTTRRSRPLSRQQRRQPSSPRKGATD